MQAALDWSYDLLSEGAKLLFIAATLGQAVGDFESAWPMNEESRKVFENAGYKKGAADVHGTGGLIALGLGRPEEALDLMQEAVRLNLGANNEWGAAAMLGFSATVPFASGDLDRARGFAERGLERRLLPRVAGDHRGGARG
jgi:tetratricopeptide (TPR) repeat protein